MTQQYPIIDQSYLRPVPDRGRLGLWKRHRHRDDLPEPHAHQLLVYRVDGQYVLDNGRLAPDDEQVVRATHVSLVDAGSEVPVMVRFSIPSAEASEFTVQTTFVCTVTDPVRVARDNLHAATAMLTYLKKHQKLVHLGFPYQLSEINQVRREIGAQIRAYAEIRPPDVPGMRVMLANVEVLTPGEFAAFEQARRKQQRDHLLASEGQNYRHELSVDQERRNQELADQQRSYRQRSDLDDREHHRLVTVQEQRHEHFLRHENEAFARQAARETLESLDGDPYQALVYAHVHGAIDAEDLARQLVADRERRDGLLRAEEQRKLDWQREDQLRLEHHEREDRLRANREEREDRLQNAREEREDRERAAQAELADRRQQWAINVEVLRDLMKRGHGDFINIRVEHLIAEVSGLRPDKLIAEPTTVRHGLPGDSTTRDAGGLPAGSPADPKVGPAVADRRPVTSHHDLELEVREEDV